MESLDEFYVQTLEQQVEVAEVMTQLEDHCANSSPLSADDLYIGKSYSVHEWSLSLYSCSYMYSVDAFINSHLF